MISLNDAAQPTMRPSPQQERVIQLLSDGAGRILSTEELVLGVYGRLTRRTTSNFRSVLHRLRQRWPDLEVEQASGYRLRRPVLVVSRTPPLSDDALGRLLLALVRGQVRVLDARPDGTTTLRILGTAQAVGGQR